MLAGSIVALVTPMRSSGEIDWPALDRLIDWHIEAGTHGIVPMGTTGESPTVNVDEHIKVIERTIERVAKRIPVVAGTGANATAEAIELTRAAAQVGADACLLVTPYYNRPTQEGLYQHYKAIAEAVDIPQVLYNVPKRTGCDMTAETVGRLAKIDNIIGIKEACGDAKRTTEIRDRCPPDFIVLSGEDSLTFEMLKLGAVGTISVTANVLPREMAQFVSAFLDGDTARAAALDAKLQPIHEILFVESSPQPTKWALHLMDLIDTGIRLPLLPMSQANRGELERRLRAVGALR
ncbi:MAG TPA: 4-hydroxy-tetrahydrodipicolinate synthase [Pseudomonadales bacterium]